MLELNNLSVGYDGRYVIRNVDLSFEPGNIYTIIGKNGSGKSTLLKSCSGLLTPKVGSVLLDGKELSKYPANQRAQKISYLSQSTNTPNITVERLLAHARFPHLSYPKKLRQEDINIIYRALGDMKAACFIHDSLRELSGGERQRVYLAMQLAQDTEVLLLDEPTTYLDIEYQLSLMELLQKLKAQGKTIIMVLHDLEQALKYSDQIIAIDAGKEIYTGTPDEILAGGILRKVFHVDVQRSDYRFELKNPAAVSSEAVITVFGNSSCRSR
ncbi:MAG: ABC transporter ATP-binding protein [Oscillospiraceae bacterium]|nr:ABC transporter ATP-binding protein [Oscillospiraceae bacterium]